MFNKILLTSGLPFRTTRGRRGAEGAIVDASALPFILCELLSHGATKVVIPMGVPLADPVAIAGLPRSLRNLVTVVNPMKARQHRDAVFQPLAEEYEFEMKGAALIFKGKTVPTFSDHLSLLYFETEVFLVAMRYRTQVEVHLRELRRCLRVLKTRTRNPQGIASLSLLEGLLGTYVPLNKEGIQLAGRATQDQIAVFRKFVEDEAYRKISEENYLLGFPDKFGRAIQLIARFSRGLQSKPYFRPLCRVITGGVGVATNVPVFDAADLAPLLGRGFLPPVVSIAKPIDRARKAWWRAEPPFVPMSDNESLLSGSHVISWDEEKSLRKENDWMY